VHRAQRDSVCAFARDARYKMIQGPSIAKAVITVAPQRVKLYGETEQS
jgi:hypothetical protein